MAVPPLAAPPASAAARSRSSRPALLRIRQLTGGLIIFLFQFLILAGVFFIVPLFLSVVLGLSPMATGVRLLPLSLSLLLAAVGIPKLVPRAYPRRVVRIGMLALIVGILVLIAQPRGWAPTPRSCSSRCSSSGLGMGALASQLGNVTVSSVPTEQSAEVGGLQNTASQLGASIGTALAGSILIAALTTSFLAGIQANPNVPAAGEGPGQHQPRSGRPLHLGQRGPRLSWRRPGSPTDVQDDILTTYEDSQIAGLRTALSILAVMGVIALFFTGRIPKKQPGSEPAPAGSGSDPDGEPAPA